MAVLTRPKFGKIMLRIFFHFSESSHPESPTRFPNPNLKVNIFPTLIQFRPFDSILRINLDSADLTPRDKSVRNLANIFIEEECKLKIGAKGILFSHINKYPFSCFRSRSLLDFISFWKIAVLLIHLV